MSMQRSAAVHRGWPLLGALPGLRADLLGELERAAVLGAVVRLALPLLPPVFLATTPQGVRHVLQTKSRQYGRTRFHDRLKPVLGDGLLTAEGDAWERQRRLLQPHFTGSAVRRFLPQMTASIEAHCRAWAVPSPAPVRLDIAEAMSAMTLEIILRCMFGRASTGDIPWAVREAQIYTAQRFWRLIDLPLAVPTPANRRFSRALSAMESAVDGILATAREPDDVNLLSDLEAAHAGDQARRHVRDEVMTTLLAGHETSAVGLAWALHLLAGAPAAAERVREEAEAVLGAAPPDGNAVAGLDFARAVVQEAMRLYPPVPWSARRAIEADIIAGIAVPANAIVIYSPWLLHRDPRLWPDPLDFRPERFLGSAAGEGPVPWSFLPFGGGPRICIGLYFAMTEMVLALSSILRRFDLSPPSTTVQPQALITLRANGPMPLLLRPRLLEGARHAPPYPPTPPPKDRRGPRGGAASP